MKKVASNNSIKVADKVASNNNIKVAVRVRPFNEREKSHGAQRIISMKDNVTNIVRPDGKEQKKFSFDFSYWSHDQFTVRDDGYLIPDGNSTYVDQEKVFADLGRGMLDHAWNGYNSSLFAYGQTGSGKSYSIMGDKVNQGLVPRTCAQLFSEMQEKKKPDLIFEVSFSMMEIYNEQINDLLSYHKGPPGGLKVREIPQRGFYVEGLVSVAVGSYDDIAQRMNEGNKKRTIAATKMNETSSRAHTLITLNFTQNNKKERTSMQSTIILVDLAGSERQRQTEATGDRFKEAVNINQSLTTLGNVIHALVDKTKGKTSMIPYRDSLLTMLLKNALGGNSKTVMIATISPDSENYEQTLSTLRYADRVKQIRTDAKINMVDTNKMIAALIAEKKKLLSELENAKKESGYTEEDIRRLKDEQKQELRAYEEKLTNMEKALQKRLAEARQEMEKRLAEEKEQEEAFAKMPHLSNLNEDMALCDKLRHVCKPGFLTLGKGNDVDILLHGPGIVAQHAKIRYHKNEVVLTPLSGSVLHNGRELTKKVTLNHGDRIRFGSNNLYLFCYPAKAEEEKHKKQFRTFTYEDAQEEIAKNSGLDLSGEDRLLQDEVISVLPIVQTVNAMAKEMNKPVTFSMILVPPEARGLDTGRTELYVRLTDEDTGNEYLWPKLQFLTRQSYMKDHYQQFEETGIVPIVNQTDDPFWEPPDLEVVVGIATLPLKFLAHMIEFEQDPRTVLDYSFKHCGFVDVQLIPCDKSGKEVSDLAVEDPFELVQKSVSFKIKIIQAMNLPARFSSTYCKYKFYTRAEYSKTADKTGNNPKFGYEEVITIPSVDFRLVEYLREKSMAIEVWGKQKSMNGSARSKKNHTPTLNGSSSTELQQTIRYLEHKLEQIEQIVSQMPETTAQKAELLEVLWQ